MKLIITIFWEENKNDTDVVLSKENVLKDSIKQ